MTTSALNIPRLTTLCERVIQDNRLDCTESNPQLQQKVNEYFKIKQAAEDSQNDGIQNPSAVGIEELPPELMLHTFSYLPVKSLAMSSLVCKTWYAFCNDNQLWNHMLARDYATTQPVANPKEHYQNYPSESNLINGIYATRTCLLDVNNYDYCYFKNGKLISIIGNNAEIRIWDVESGLCESILEKATFLPISRLISLEHGMLAIADNFNIHVFSLTSGKCEKSFERFLTSALLLTAPDKLISCNSNGLEILDLNSGETTIFRKTESKIYSLACRQDGKFISGDVDGNIQIRNSTGKCEYSLLRENLYRNGIANLTITRQGRVISHGEGEKEIKIWDLNKKKCVQTFRIPDLTKMKPCYLSDLYFTKNNKLVLAEEHIQAAEGGKVAILDFNASHKEVFEELANLFEGSPEDQAMAMKRFMRMPEEKKNQVYCKLYHIMKPFDNDYFGCGQDAFLGRNGLNATPQQRAEAIRKSNSL